PDFRWKTSFVPRWCESRPHFDPTRPGIKLLATGNESEFILIPENASPDASPGIRVRETAWNRATRQTSNLKCDPDGGFRAVARGIRYVGPSRRCGRSQSSSASFARNCSPAPARIATRRLVRNYCETRSGDRDLCCVGR